VGQVLTTGLPQKKLERRLEMKDFGEPRLEKIACQTPEEINLVRRIDQCTSELYQSLNAIDSGMDVINKDLLPLQQDSEKECADKKEPSGWFEKHFDFLMTIYTKSVKIHGKIMRLDKEVKGSK